MGWWIAMAAGCASLAALPSGAAQAAVNIRVDLARQSMHVVSSDGETHDWAVSTARRGFVTPRGTFGVRSLQRMHLSRKYHNSPMPYSIFFRGGYAIHGTYSTAALGRAASHGCVRLSPQHAATLFQMVKAEGAHITIAGSAPNETAEEARAIPTARRPQGDAIGTDGTRIAERDARPHRHRPTVAARPVLADPMAVMRLGPGEDDWPGDALWY